MTVFGRFPLGSRHYCYLLQKLAYFETRILYDRKQAPGFTFQFANDFPARIAQISVRRIWLNVVNMVRADHLMPLGISAFSQFCGLSTEDLGLG